MAGDHADLRSVAGLERLAEKLNAAPAAIDACLRETEDSLLPRMRALERAADKARDALRRAERACEAAQNVANDDKGERRAAVHAAESTLEDARERLERIENAMGNVRQALSRYKSAAADLSIAQSGALAQGAAYLAERLSAAYAYLSIRPSQTAAESPPSSKRSELGQMAIQAAEVVMGVSTVVQLATGAVDAALGKQCRDPSPDEARSELLGDMLDKGQHVGFELEQEGKRRREQTERAVQADGSPQVTLFDPTLTLERREPS